MRKCDCWLDVETCFCETENSGTRYSVLKDGITYSKWETINEALEDGRNRLENKFTVFDNLENREVLKYE